MFDFWPVYSGERFGAMGPLVTSVCWHQMIEISFKQYLFIYLHPLSLVPKSKVGKSLHIQIGLVSLFAGFL